MFLFHSQNFVLTYNSSNLDNCVLSSVLLILSTELPIELSIGVNELLSIIN